MADATHERRRFRDHTYVMYGSSLQMERDDMQDNLPRSAASGVGRPQQNFLTSQPSILRCPGVTLVGRLVLASLIGSLLPYNSSIQAADDRDVLLARFQTNRPILRPETEIPRGQVRRIQLSEEGGQLRVYAAGDDKVVRKWLVHRTHDRRMDIRYEATIRWPINRTSIGGIFALDLHPNLDGKRYVAFGGAGSDLSQVQIVNVAQPDDFELLKPAPSSRPSTPVYSLSFHPQLSVLAVAHGGQTNEHSAEIGLWGWRDGNATNLSRVNSGFDRVDAVKFSPSGKYLLAANRADRQVATWEYVNDPGTVTRRGTTRTMPSSVNGIAWVSDLRWVAATAHHGLQFGSISESNAANTESSAPAELFNATNGPVHYRVWLDEKQNYGPPTTLPANAGQVIGASRIYLLANPDDAPEKAVDAINLQGLSQQDSKWEVRLLNGGPRFVNASVVTAIDTNPVQSLLLYAVWDVFRVRDGQKPGQVQLIGNDRTRQEIVLENAGFDGDVTAVGLSPDGRYAIAAGVDRFESQTSGGDGGNVSGIEIRIWSVPDGRLLGTFPDATAATAGSSISRVTIPADDSIAFARGSLHSNIQDATFYEFYGKNIPPLPQPTHQFQMKAPGWARNESITATDTHWQIRFKNNEYWLKPINRPVAEMGPFPVLPGSGPPLAVEMFELEKKAFLAIGYATSILVWDVEAVNAGKAGRRETQADAIARAFFGPEGKVNSLAASTRNPRSPWLLVGSDDGTLSAWSLKGVTSRTSRRRELQTDFEMVAGRLQVTDVDATGPGWAAGFEKGQEIVGVELPRAELARNEWSVPEKDWLATLQLPIPGESLYVTVRAGKTEAASTRQHVLGTQVMHEPLWTMYPQVDGEWVAWSPYGYFDASSEETMDDLGWHKNLDLSTGACEFFSSDVFRSGFHKSHLVRSRLLQARRPLAPPDVFLYPSSVKISQVVTSATGQSLTDDQNSIEIPADLRVSVEADQRDNEEIIGLKVWCNGQLIADTDDPSLGMLGSRSLEKTRAVLEGINVGRHLLRSGQSNFLSAVVESRVVGPDGVPARMSNSAIFSFFVHGVPQRRIHYLGIGVTRLDHAAEFQRRGISELKFSANDAYALGREFKTQCASQFTPGTMVVAANKDDVALLSQSELEIIPPSRDEILASLDTIVQQATADDLVCLFVSSHGFSNRDGFFLLMEETDGKLGGALTREDVYSRLRRLPCATLLLIDACHSGGIDSNRELRDAGDLKVGPAILASSKPGQLSWETDQVQWDVSAQTRCGHGVFTAAILEALAAQRLDQNPATATNADLSLILDRDGDRMLSLDEFCHYVQMRTRKLAPQPQDPVFIPSLTVRSRDLLLRPIPARDTSRSGQ